jgi:hypothetical protein
MGGTAERLGAQDLWVVRVGRKDLTPGVPPPAVRSLYADAPHWFTPLLVAVGGALVTEAPGHRLEVSGDRALGG